MAGVETSLELAKRLAAKTAVNEWIHEGTKAIGIGTGATVRYAIEYIAELRWAEGQICDFVCVPTSYLAAQLITQHKLSVSDLEHNPRIDVTFDGADEVDRNMAIIKGGSGCMSREKVIAYNSKNLIIMCNYTKKSERLGQQWCKGIPIEVLSSAVGPVTNFVKSTYDGELELRMASKKVGPVITENMNNILDWRFVEKRDYDWREFNQEITMLPGVIETGLFVDMATKVYFAMPDGTVCVQNRKPLYKCSDF